MVSCHFVDSLTNMLLWPILCIVYILVRSIVGSFSWFENYAEPVPGKTVNTLTVNFGPQHPAAHGVLRLIIELNGEVSNR